MTKLTPLLPDVDVRTYKGRYEVQLEIPTSSTLSEQDIDRVLAISSWDVDPNKVAEGYEGSRSVLIPRTSPITKRGIELRALQVSGIGYLPIDFSTAFCLQQQGTSFQVPTTDNFIDLMPGTEMTTSYAKNRKMAKKRPDYRALGTYTSPELKTKLKNTVDISQTEEEVGLEKLVVPHVEAYGRFVDDRLRDEQGPFGLMIFPVPSTTLQRTTHEIVEKYREFLPKTEDLAQAIYSFYIIAAAHFTPLVAGLRELHDKARFAHLQPHLSNVYNIRGIPYLMDWGTSVRLGEDRENNLVNRTIDIFKPLDNFIKMFSTIFGGFCDEQAPKRLRQPIIELIYEVYRGGQEEIHIEPIVQRVSRKLGSEFTDVEFTAQWMKDQGLEGFQRYEPPEKPQQLSQPSPQSLQPPQQDLLDVLSQNKLEIIAGRNDPCPCGSGKKFKFCCLRK